MPDTGLINFDSEIDLRVRRWASDGTLDNAVLVEATDGPGFGGFSLWDIDAGEGSLINAGSGDFELLLDSGGSAEHGAGVLNAPDDGLYVVSFDTGTDNAEVTVELVIDGVSVSSQTAEYAPGSPDRGGVIFDLSTLNLAAFTFGSSDVSIRVTNNEGDDLSLDNFELIGGEFPQIEQFGSTIFDDSALSGAITAEIDDIQFTNATGAEAAAAEAAIDFEIIETSGGGVTWSFSADKTAFDFLSSGEQTAVQIILTLSGADGGSTVVPVLIGITGDNQAPSANDQSVTVTEDGSISGTLTADDVDGDSLSFQVVDRPQNGEVTINTDGTFTYAPDADSTAPDSFTFKATDPFGGQSVGTVNVAVDAENDAPENDGNDLNGSFEILPGGFVVISLAGLELSDPDATGLTVSFDASGGGTFAVTSGDLAGNNVSFTGNQLSGDIDDLNAFFRGSAEVTYTDTTGQPATISVSVSDGGQSGAGGDLTTSLGSIFVDVDSAPTADDLSVTAVEDGSVAGTLPGNDPDGDALFFSLGSAAANGTAVVNDDGTFVYTPFSNFNGTDSFTYLVNDGGSTVTGTVSVTVEDAVDLPIARDEFATVLEDGSVSGQLDGLNTNGGSVIFSLASGGAPIRGAVTIDPDGDFVYTPFANANGSDFFTFIVDDGANQRTATGFITITPEQDAPVLEVEFVSVDEDSSVVGQLDAADVDGETLTFALVDGASKGKVTVDASGAYIYTPDADFNGSDSFTYSVTDGIETIVETAVVEVNPVNDAPVPEALSLEVDEDGLVAGQVIANDIDGDNLTFAIVGGTGPSFGEVDFNPDGSFTYTPDPDANGVDGFEVSVTDGVVTLTTTVSITVNAVNDAPLAADDSTTIKEDRPVLLELAANDSDIDGGALFVSAVSDPVNGTAVVTADGKVLYTPDTDFFGEDSFTYTVSDGNGGFDQGAATITILAQGETPVIGTDGDDVFNVRDHGGWWWHQQGFTGRDRAFEGGEGEDVIFNTRRGHDITLSESSFESIERIDANHGDIKVDADGRLDLSNITEVVNVDEIEGSNRGNELIFGSQDDDRIDGEDGEDSLFGGLGNDSIEGDHGDDSIEGGAGDDLLEGDDGRDVISGGEGNDTIEGGEGGDTLDGGAGDDTFLVDDKGGDGDEFNGGDGNDVIRNDRNGGHIDLTEATFDGIEAIDARGGDIRVDKNQSLDLSAIAELIDVDEIKGQSGDETITGSQDDDFIDGEGGDDLLSGGDGNDTIEGDHGRDTMDGGDGDDVFEVHGDEGEGDVFIGGAGDDVLRNTSNSDIELTNATLDGIETIDANGRDIEVDRHGALDLSGVETIIDARQIDGDSGNETIVGSQDDDHIDASSGNDSISGGSGDDTLEGDSGRDTQDGGAGNDLFLMNHSEGSGDVIRGGEGEDTIFNEHRRHDLDLTGADILGVEVIDANGADITVDRNGVLDLSDVREIIDVDEIEGDRGNETITGSQGSDFIDGKSGRDTVRVNGNVADFEFDIQGNGRATVSGPGIGDDTLKSIESVEFDDYTLFLDGRNNAAVERPDDVTTDEDTALSLADADLLANDFDPEGDSFGITGVRSEEIAISRDGSGNIIIDPDDAFEALAAGESETVIAFYDTVDENGATQSGQINVTVTGVNDGPIGVDDTAETSEETSVSGNVLANDTDVDNGAVLTVSSVEGQAANVGQLITLSSGATVQLNVDGSFEYDPGDAFAGTSAGEAATDSFSYVVTDEHGAESNATVNVAINGDNDPLTANDDRFEIAARRALIQEEDSGVLANDVDVDANDKTEVVAVDGAGLQSFFRFEDGEFVEFQRFVGEGSEGGRFFIGPNGEIVFDSGRDFDDLDSGESRETTIEYTASDGNGSLSTASVTIVVNAADLAPIAPGGSALVNFATATAATGASGPAVGGFAAPAAFDASNSVETTVSGTFEQLGGIDLIEELFQRLTGDQTLDLDTLFDLNLVDIDTTFDMAFDPQNGFDVTITDNNPQSDAILTGFGDELNLAAEFVTDLINPVVTAPTSPVFFGPDFDFSATVEATFGWDVTAPTLGKTAIFQPASFDFFSPDGPIAEFGAYELFTGGVTVDTPTVTMQTVGLGDISFDAAYALTDARLSDVGFVIGTQDFLGLDLDGIFEGRIGLAGDIDIAQALAESAPDVLGQGFSISGSDILNGLVTIGVQDFIDAIQALAEDPGAQTAQDLGRLILRSVNVATDEATARFEVGGAQLKASELVELHDRSRFNEFDRFDESGTGLFDLTAEDGSIVSVTRADVENVMNFNGITDTIDELVDLLGEDGFTIIDGLTIKATLPIGNIEDIEGYGNGATGERDGEQTITVEQKTRLAGVEVDFEALQTALAEIAIDKAIEKSLQSPNQFTPIIVGAGLGAKAALLIGPHIQDFVEQGVTSTTQIRPLELVAATVNPLIDLLNIVSGVANTVLGAIGLPQIPDIPNLTVENLETAFDASIDAVANGIIFVLDGLSSVASDVLNFFADNPVTSVIDDALNIVKNVTTDGIGGVLDALESAIDVVGGALGIGDALSFLDAIFDVARAGNTAVANFDNIISSLFSELAAAQANISQFLQDGVDEFRDMVKNIARGVELSLDTEFNQFEFTIDAGFDLIQRATFNPDEVEVTYQVDGYDVTTGLGEAATFFADGNSGDTLDGSVTYEFSGDVDYDYIIELDITPELTLYGFEVDGDLAIGDPNEGESYNFNFEYAGVKITDDFGLEELGNLELTELFDDALLELPFGLVEDVAETVADQIRNSLGGFAGQTDDLDFNQFRLFEIDGVEIGQEQFSEITHDFELVIGDAVPDPVVTLTFNEDSAGELGAFRLADGVQGTLSKIDGDALNFDQFVNLDTGGRVLVNFAGDVAFIADGAYEHLAVGEIATTELEFSVDQPDGFQRTFTATIQVLGANDAPEAVDDTAVALEDGNVIVDVVANDTDVDQDVPLLLASASSDDGVATVTPDGRVSFSPNADFFGQAILTYTVQDQFGATSEGTLIIDVQPTPDPVVAVDDVVLVNEDQPVAFDVTANDFEIDGDNVEVVGFDQPANGSLSLNDLGELVFSPDGAFEALAVGESSTETVAVTVADPDGQSQSTLTLVVLGANDAPEAADDAAVTREDESITLALAANDTDIDGDALVVVAVGSASNGSVQVTGDGQVIYTPDADFFGSDSFTYTVGDPHGGTATGTSTIAVRAQGEIAVVGTAGDDIFQIRDNRGEDRAFDGGDGFDTVVNTRGGDINLTGTSFDSIEVLDVNGADIDVDRNGRIDLSEVGLIIDVGAIEGNRGDETIIGSGGGDRVEADDGADLVFGGSGNDTLLGEDDADTMDGGAGDDLFLISGGDGEGDVFIGGDGQDTVRNTGNGDINLTGAVFDSIELLDANGADIDVDRNGSLDLSGVGQIIDLDAIEGSGGRETIIGGAGNESVEAGGGDDLVFGGGGDDTLEGEGGDDTLDGGEGNDVFEVDTTDAIGSTYIGGDGTDTILNTRRNQDFNLTDATLDSIEIIDANDGDIDVSSNGFLDLSSIQTVLRADEIEGTGGNETVVGTQDDDVIDLRGGFDTVVVRGDAQDFTFAITGDEEAIVSGASIGFDTVENVEVISFDNYDLFLDGRNNAAVTFLDQFTISEDGALVISDADLLANDIDPDGDAISLTGIVSGEIDVNREADGTITIDTNGAFEGLALGEDQTVSLTYSTDDGQGGTSNGAVEVTVTGVNDGPVGVNDAVATVEEAAVSGNLLANDEDEDNGAVLRVVSVEGLAAGALVTLASGALVSVSANGDFTYDPGSNFESLSEGVTATDSFTYVLEDEYGAQSSATATVTVTGDNEGPNDGDESLTVEASFAVDVNVAQGLLANASDADADDVLSVVGADGVAELAGSNGGTFTLAADGSFQFDTGSDFNSLQLGESATTALTYEVQDDKGAVTESTVEITVNGSGFDPFGEDEDRFDNFDQSDIDALSAATVSGTFEQLGGVDALTALAEDITGTEVDLATIFDITFLDIDKTIIFRSLPGEEFEFEIIDNTAPEGQLDALNGVIDSAFTALGDVADALIPLDIGPVEIQPTFDAAIELDIGFGIDIDLPTLGKAAFFQPIDLTLLTPDQVAAGDAFILRSQDLFSQTPETVIETIGLGSFDIETEFSILDSTLSSLGYSVASSDFGPFALDGLASQSTVFNAELNLGEVIEDTKQFIIDIVDDLTGILGENFPFDVSAILDTLFSLNVGNIVTNILSGQVTIDDLIDIIQTGSPEEIADAVVSLVNRLSQEPEEQPTADLNGSAVTAQELHDLSKRALFNEFDGFDDGVGFFELPAVDGDGEPTGETVQATEAEVFDLMNLLGVNDRIQATLDSIRSFEFAPFDGLAVNFAIPLENIETVEGFGLDGNGDLITGSLAGEQIIEVRQESPLIDIAIDFEEAAFSLIDQMLSASAEFSPQAQAMRTYLAFAKQVQGAAEEGVELDLQLNPAQLVSAALNGAIDALNVTGEAIDFIVPGNIFDEIPSISDQTTLDIIDGAIDGSVGAIANVFGAVESMIADVAGFLGTILNGVSGGLNGLASVLGVATDLVGGAIGSAISALESVRDFGFEIDLLFKTIEIKPFKAIVDAPIALLEGLQTAVNAADSGVDAISSFAGQISNAASSLNDFSLDGVLSGPLDDFATFLKDLARGAELSTQLSMDMFEATVEAGLSVVQIARFNPDDVTVNYDVNGFEIDAGLGESVGMFANGQAGETIEGEATYNFSGEVDYEYRMKLDLDPNFRFFESEFFGRLALGENIEENFADGFTFAAISDVENGVVQNEPNNALLDIQFDFTEAVTEVIEDAFAASLGQVVPVDANFENGELFLFDVNGVELDQDRFTSITQQFQFDII